MKCHHRRKRKKDQNCSRHVFAKLSGTILLLRLQQKTIIGMTNEIRPTFLIGLKEIQPPILCLIFCLWRQANVLLGQYDNGQIWSQTFSSLKFKFCGFFCGLCIYDGIGLPIILIQTGIDSDKTDHGTQTIRNLNTWLFAL